MLSVKEQKKLQQRQDVGAPSFRSKTDKHQASNKVRLSTKTKESVLNINKINDPFHPDIQKMFDEFIDHVDNSSQSDVDLSEVGLLLAGVTKIYSAQVDAIVEDIHNLVAFVTKTIRDPNDKKKRGRHKKDNETDTLESSDNDKNEPKNNDPSPVDDKSDNPGEVICKVEGEEATTETDLIASNTENCSNPSDPSDPLLNAESDANSGSAQDPSIDVPENSVPDNTAEDSGISVGASESPSDELQNQILNEIPGPNTRKRLELIQNILQLDENGEPMKKKSRSCLVLPPTLISCFDELRELEESGQMNNDNCDLLPPVLEMAARISRKRNMLYTEDAIKEPKKFKDFIPLAQLTLPNPEIKESAIGTENIQNIEADSGKSSDPLDVNAGPETVPDTSINLADAFGGIPPIPSNAHTFSAEDQSAIQECINELHYLPFTFELSKTDLASAFSRTVERMSEIFQKNNVQVTRSMMKGPAVVVPPAADKIEKPSGSNGIVNPGTSQSLSDIYTAIVKNCREECESFVKTVMEPTQEKSFAESRANIRAMISELQRNIVPKYSRVPLMAENTPEFFLHVTNFEKKMKRILEEEAKKEEFDVRKYEREVLEVTAKESSELDRMSVDLQMPQSPLKPQSIDGEVNLVNDGAQASPSTRSSFDGSHSSLGGSWVPIKHIFQHMKSIDKTEAARLFYAVLALLSYQNLDINYDQLYSKESAALITQQLKGREKEEDMDIKFRRGVKIMNSRCPDVDKEEVYVAALTAESRDEAFRHLLNKESNLLGKSGKPGTSRNAAELNGFDEGIAEAMADFVEESGTIFSGRLEGRRRKNKPS